MDRKAENILVLRKKADLTQTELAENSGVSKFTVLTIEKGSVK